MTCQCGHIEKRHCDGIGRCDGMSEDPDYGKYRCMCPRYKPVSYCDARMSRAEGWTGIFPRCAQPPGHDGYHRTTYGLEFDDEGETINDSDS